MQQTVSIIDKMELIRNVFAFTYYTNTKDETFFVATRAPIIPTNFSSPAFDLVFYPKSKDGKMLNAQVIVALCMEVNFDDCMNYTQNILNKYTDIQECIIFDCELERWFKWVRDAKGLRPEPRGKHSKSKILDYDLEKTLQTNRKLIE